MTKTKGISFRFYALLFLSFLFFSLSRAFYLPGVAPRDFQKVMASKSKIYFVLEFVAGGELFDKISSKGRLKEDEARKYFQRLINAVDYCHSRGVYHRDLKPENLLLDANGALKVSNFGLSALPQQVREDGLLHTTCGTSNYVAPELSSTSTLNLY